MSSKKEMVMDKEVIFDVDEIAKKQGIDTNKKYNVSLTSECFFDPSKVMLKIPINSTINNIKISSNTTPKENTICKNQIIKPSDIINRKRNKKKPRKIKSNPII
jgi:hypothetical protein